MKVIGVDNFGRESVADVVIKENVTCSEGERIVSKYNDSRYTRPYWAVLVVDEHKLWRGMEELV